MKRTRETVVPFAKLKKKFQARRLENVLLHHIHVDEMKKSDSIHVFIRLLNACPLAARQFSSANSIFRGASLGRCGVSAAPLTCEHRD